MMQPHRNHPLWLAFIVHRLSGIGLALFLPAHFWLLGLALRQDQAMNTALAWANNPIVKMAEFGLIFLLAVHMFGGLRLLALEFLPWKPFQKTLASLAVAVSFIVACIFIIASV